MKSIRIWLGGSFDPIHLGHLTIMKHIATVLNDFLILHHFQNTNIIISLLPTARNPLKTNPTENFHRLAMLESGLQDLQRKWQNTSICFQIDTSEIYQTETVFTFNTFTQFREKYPYDSLIFVLGMDSVMSFDKWYRAYELPILCHLWVMPRRGEIAENSANLPEKLKPFLTNDLANLILSNNGHIYVDKHCVMTVSSSQIRAILQDKTISLENKKSLLQPFLNQSVLDYILEHDLYHA